jgi:hypothetical protein
MNCRRALLACSIVVVGAGLAFSQSNFRRGDVNGDGAVDLTDAITTLEVLFLAEGSISCEDAADANDDGNLDISDAVRTLIFLFAGGPPLPEPGASCGDDPTEDDLGCLSHSGCDVIHGIAAVGGPLLGRVIIKDSRGEERSATTACGGTYAVSIAGMTPPFLLRAEGQAGDRLHMLHSAATAADMNGNINITTLTELIVSGAAGQVAADLFNSGDLSTLTSGNLNTAETALQARLEAVLTDLGIEASIDLRRGAFRCDHQGLDAALDSLRVFVDAAMRTATIANVFNGAAIVDDLNVSSDTGVLDSKGAASGWSDWEAILARIARLQEILAADPPPDDPELLAQFDQVRFLDSGRDLATFLDDITADPWFARAPLASLSLVSYTPATDARDGRAEVTLGIADSTCCGLYAFTWVMTGIHDAGSGRTDWLIAGDQRIVNLDMEMRSILGFNPSDPAQIQSGLDLDIAADPTGDIDYAVVTGPGLDAGGGADGSSAGALLATPPDWGGVALVSGPYTGPGTPPHTRGANHATLYSWTDAEIAALPACNLTYTVKLYDDRGTAADLADDVELAAYQVNFLEPPLPAGSLSAARFPVITDPPIEEILAIAETGGPLTVTWTRPGGLAVESFFLMLFYSDGSWEEVSADVSPPDTGATVQLPSPPPGEHLTGMLLDVVAADCYNVNYSYRLWAR